MHELDSLLDGWLLDWMYKQKVNKYGEDLKLTQCSALETIAPKEMGKATRIMSM